MQHPADHLNIENYTYDLPEDRIAKFPLSARDQSKLLVWRKGSISTSSFSRLPEYISAGDIIVFNNTRVIPARIEMTKETGARIEILCLEPHDPHNYQSSLSCTHTCTWKCMVGNSKKWKSGILTKRVRCSGTEIYLHAELEQNCGHHKIIKFTWNSSTSFADMLDSCGIIPIPPYLNRKTEEIDRTRYQTVYSRHSGSVAAPTAGLHFTPQILQRLADSNVRLAELTLHVGAGTFRPLQHSSVSMHDMHTEHFHINIDVINSLLDNMGTVTAAGTTSLRALESIYWLGVKMLHHDICMDSLHLEQWEAFTLPQDITLSQSLLKIRDTLQLTGRETLFASTKIMIIPGYALRVCRRLITNFHQPQSTLLLIIGAFAGERWRDIYQYALDNGYRFLSYGDSSLLEL